ncbi:molecular chaperone HscC [Novosphingobium flavum]|uniref:Molecular chaperone HscC n=1 Tax=Novosphingobium flavum TaxID=1778672 RepID=A0A7X1KN49_9SPHN|nr:molecular chaperone HscC [Novosphingobium flavum]MBC2667319.1 molecular chaperone HscC [Novosphingobium flavum]
MIVGIDLGTTNSAVAIWRDGQAILVSNALGDPLTPSAVSLDPDGKTYVGAAALERFGTHPNDTALSFKRYMGTDRTVSLGKRKFKADDLSALVLKSLCDDVEAAFGERPAEAVITVPAYFNDRQRKATRRAGEIAGLKVRRLINEPTAAALAFGLQDQEDREPFLVFDLGGGTFDVSIVEKFEGVVEVRASAGDNRLGGDDFNAALAGLVKPRLDPSGLLARLDDVKREALLLRAAEAVRRQLSEADEAVFTVIAGEERLETRVTAADLEEASAALIQRLREPVVRALRDCTFDVAELSEIVLVGGATRMPIVRKAITRMFGRFPNATVHPDHAVALGAAVQAGLLSRDAALEEIRISDVCPFTLGVDMIERDSNGHIHHGVFSPIIDRNTPVPVSRLSTYQTVQDNQRELRFNIYQGEARVVSGNIHLGVISVPVPPRPAGEITADVRFSYDSSGLLEVDVTIPQTALQRSLVIVDEADRQSEKDLAERRAALAKLKFHPREEAQNVALMARADKTYEDLIGDERQAVGHWITEFAGALESQDPRRIADARAILGQRLDAIAAEAPL